MTDDPSTTKEHDNLISALAAARAKFPTIVKDKTAKVISRKGGSYSYSYADLADILAAVTPVLAQHGLAVLQKLEAIDHGTLLVTELCHGPSRERERSTILLPPFSGESAQEWASACSYARRYSITALLSIAADEDDDGKMASDGGGHDRGPSRQVADQRRPRQDERPLSPRREVEEALKRTAPGGQAKRLLLDVCNDTGDVYGTSSDPAQLLRLYGDAKRASSDKITCAVRNLAVLRAVLPHMHGATAERLRLEIEAAEAVEMQSPNDMTGDEERSLDDQFDDALARDRSSAGGGAEEADRED